jgi:hypothetical protein
LRKTSFLLYAFFVGCEDLFCSPAWGNAGKAGKAAAGLDAKKNYIILYKMTTHKTFTNTILTLYSKKHD